MSKLINLSNIVEALDFQSDDCTQNFDRQAGQFEMLTDEEIHAAEDEGQAATRLCQNF